MALKDKIITYNLEIEYTGIDVTVIWIFDNISRVAVDNFINWCEDNYTVTNIRKTANMVKK